MCLEPLFIVKDDEFFNSLYINYAKILSDIFGMRHDPDA